VPLAAALRSEHPELDFCLVSGFAGYLTDWLQRGDIDFAVLYDPQASRSLKSKPLLIENLFLIGPPGATLSPVHAIPFERLETGEAAAPKPGPRAPRHRRALRERGEGSAKGRHRGGFLCDPEGSRQTWSWLHDPAARRASIGYRGAPSLLCPADRTGPHPPPGARPLRRPPARPRRQGLRGNDRESRDRSGRGWGMVGAAYRAADR
jgi:hypothetical protein